MAKRRKNFLPLLAARDWALGLKLKSRAGWVTLRRCNEIPDNIPSNPQVTYGDDFRRAGGWGWFLGTGNVRPLDMIWMPFHQARVWARKSDAKSQTSWNRLNKQQGWLRADIPAAPTNVYKEQWQGWGDFLGTGRLSKKNRISYADAAAYGRSRGFKSMTEWVAATKRKNWPANIPKHLHSYYGDEYIKNGLSGGFFGTGRNQYPWRPLAEISQWARDRHITSFNDWRRYIKAHGRPVDIPSCPHISHRTEFIAMGGWGGFLGTGNKKSGSIEYLAMDEAQAFISLFGFESMKGWQLWCKKNKGKHLRIPRHPRSAYGPEFTKRGGFGWFLGNGNKSPSDKNFRSCPEASRWAIKQGITSQSEWIAAKPIRPKDIPSDLAATYGDDFVKIGGWNGFLNVHRRRGLSIMEVCLDKALSFVLADKNSNLHFSWGARGSKADYASGRNKIVFEYDGVFYHSHRIDKDKEKTRAIRRLGWTVIRVREKGLSKIQRKLDLIVDPSKTIECRIQLVCQHIVALSNNRAITVSQATVRRAQRVVRCGVRHEWLRAGVKVRWDTIDKASQWAVKNGVGSQNDWNKKIKIPGFRPSNIPSCPSKVYGADFIAIGGWGGFLKTGSLSPMARKRLRIEKENKQFSNDTNGGQRHSRARTSHC